jgi:hypothetical protein
MLEGVEIGFAFPEGPAGALPQVSRIASLAGPFSFWFPVVDPPAVEPVVPVFEPVLDPVVEPVLPEPEVELLVVEPVLAPVGFEDVGTTAGTEVQALS